MCQSIRQGRRCIKDLFLKKAAGGVQIYTLCLGILFLLVIFFAVLLDYKRVAITSEAVDDALVTSLISSCVYNKEEESLSGATVMYRTVTDSGLKLPVEAIIPGYVDVTGNLSTTVEDRDVLGGSTIRSPLGDRYLNNCYELFCKNLKKNLKCNDAFECAMSGIEGVVEVTEFSVYNQFFNLDQYGNQADFMFIQYTRIGEGVYRVTEYPKNTYPTCYNSLTKSDYTITNTSVAATLSFRIPASRYASNGGTIDNTGTYADITYSRVVDLFSTR